MRALERVELLLLFILVVHAVIAIFRGAGFPTMAGYTHSRFCMGSYCHIFFCGHGHPDQALVEQERQKANRLSIERERKKQRQATERKIEVDNGVAK